MMENNEFDIDEQIRPMFRELWSESPAAKCPTNLSYLQNAFTEQIVDRLLAKKFDGVPEEPDYNPYLMSQLLARKGFKVVFTYEDVIEAEREFKFRIRRCGSGYHAALDNKSRFGATGGTMRELADFLDEICSRVPYIRQCVAEEYAVILKRQRLCEIANKVALAVIPKHMRCTVAVSSPSLYCVTLYYGKRKHRRKYIPEDRLVQIEEVIKKMVQEARHAAFSGQGKN